jgi:hypothetical protein
MAELSGFHESAANGGDFSSGYLVPSKHYNVPNPKRRMRWEDDHE